MQCVICGRRFECSMVCGVLCVSTLLCLLALGGRFISLQNHNKSTDWCGTVFAKII